MKLIDLVTVVTGILPYILLISGILNGKIKQSFATWVLWCILDIIVVWEVVTQHGNYLLYSVFALGTLLTAISLIYKKIFSWGRFETFISILVTLCIAVIIICGSHYGIIFTTTALNIAGIPQLKDTFQNPKSTSKTAYLLFALSGMLSTIGAESWSVEERLPSMSAMIYCLLILLFSLRRTS